MFFGQTLFDPLTRGPLLGSLSLGISSALIGSFMYLRRQNLIAETLSHTAYPGVALALSALALTSLSIKERFATFAALSGALAISWVGLFWLGALKRQKVRQDAALCWVLSSSMGIGVLIASRLQNVSPALYQQVQNSLYGQSATITDGQSIAMALFALFCIAYIIAFSKELLALHFDEQFAKAAGLHSQLIEISFALLTSLAIIIGIRGGGIVLTTGLMVAPVAAARSLTESFAPMLFLAAFFGALSALGGSWLSLFLEPLLNRSVPAGPMMVLLGGTFALLMLLFSPKSGLIFRLWRRRAFQRRCSEENLLKAALCYGDALSHFEIKERLGISSLQVFGLLQRLFRAQLLFKRKKGCFALTQLGIKRAQYITRLHRLWELYLTQCVGMGAQRVHANAEQIEHVITPEIERQLTQLLQNPQRDPHDRAIPPLLES